MKKNVTIFCEYFGNGGIERIVSCLKEQIKKENYNVHVLCTIKNTQVYDNNVDCISSKKIRNPLYRFIKTSLNIKKYTRESQIIHLNIHSPIGLFYGYLLRKEGKKIIIHAHNSGFDHDKFKIKKIIGFIFKKLFCNKKYTYIACSEKAAKFCFKNVKYEIISNEIPFKNNGYNENERKDIRKKFDILEDDIVIGNIGRLTKQKNQEFLIRAFIDFNKIKPKSKLILVGSGPEENKINEIIRKNNICDKVVILKNYKKIEEIYQMIDLYVVPSIYEGYGLTIYEALQFSLKCIISEEISDNFKKYKNVIPVSLKASTNEWANIMNSNIGYKREYIKQSNGEYIKKIEEIYE